MTDIATRIREHLDHQESCGWHHDWPEALVALRAVLDKCDKVSVDNWGEPHYVGMAFAVEFHAALAKGLGLSDSPAVAGSQPSAAAGVPFDWKRIATQIARYGGSYHGLTTPERDAVEAEVTGENERQFGIGWDRTTDAANQGER